jgi:hypothetical protein
MKHTHHDNPVIEVLYKEFYQNVLASEVSYWFTFKSSLRTLKCKKVFEISSFHSDEYEYDSFLGCSPVYSNGSRLMFQRCILPPSSGW